jgi:hypothetical protein
MDSFHTSEKVNRMWSRLARRIERRLPDILEKYGPQDAVRHATFAEACYWKATGESDTHDVKDVLR